MSENFDEESYLIEHPDVLEAVVRGDFPSGAAHYEQHGRYEERSLRRHPSGTLPPELVNAMRRFLPLSEAIPGWCRGAEAWELFCVAFRLPDHAVIVEIGSFLGSSSVLFAGARQVRGSGRVHCIDPFDCSGDNVSVPIYQKIISEAGGGGMRAHFEANLRHAELGNWIEVHQGSAASIAMDWHQPVDLLFLDGDQSPQGARQAYEAWSPFLKIGGVLAVHNSNPRMYAPGHEGQRLIAVTEIHFPQYADVRLVDTTTFARRA